VSRRSELWRESGIVQGNGARPVASRETIVRDLGTMLGLKLEGLARFRPRALGADRWCVPVKVPPAALRPLYQLGLIGSPGSALLFPRYLLAGAGRKARAGREEPDP
jgi:hypothetical protein